MRNRGRFQSRFFVHPRRSRVVVHVVVAGAAGREQPRNYNLHASFGFSFGFGGGYIWLDLIDISHS